MEHVRNQEYGSSMLGTRRDTVLRGASGEDSCTFVAKSRHCLPTVQYLPALSDYKRVSVNYQTHQIGMSPYHVPKALLKNTEAI